MPIRRFSKIVSDVELTKLLRRFEAGTTIDVNKTIHFHHLDSDELERILPDAFEADPGFTGRQVRCLLREALWSSRKKGPLTIDSLVAEVRISRKLGSDFARSRARVSRHRGQPFRALGQAGQRVLLSQG